MFKRFLGGLVGLTALAIAGPANAILFNEIGDAGETLATAQTLPGGTDLVSGFVEAGGGDKAPGGVDLYRFAISSAITAVFTLGNSVIDDNLILFNELGQGLAGNDDCNCGTTNIAVTDTLNSRITIALAPGTYFIAVADNDTEAFDSNGAFLIDNDSGVLGAPTTNTVASFEDGFSPGSYLLEFDFTTASINPVPEPGMLALFGIGLAGLGMARRRRKAG